MGTQSFYNFLGGTDLAMNNRQKTWLLARVPGSTNRDQLNNLWYEYLGLQGYTGSLTDRWAKWLRDVQPGTFNPQSLFQGGEQGFWYDTNDLSAMWQDSAGTVPVTAANQPVGLQLDKSKGLVLGPERVSNGSFTSGTAGWGNNEATTFEVGSHDGEQTSLHVVSTAVNGGALRVGAFVVDGVFSVSYRIKVISGTVYVGSPQNRVSTHTPTSGWITVSRTAYRVSDASLRFYAETAALTEFWVTGVSVVALSGNHRFQTAAASRPMLRYNSTTGSYYLQYDGTDDFLVTNAVDFTGTDKVSVFAGVRKLSDAATGMLMELSASSSNNGVFYIIGSVSTGRYQALSRGTVTSTRDSAVYAAPRSDVLSVIADISADSLVLRTSGAGVSSLTDQGAGTYGNYPMYFGRRAGTSLPFNGHEYSPICVGRLATSAEIAAVEEMLARQVGVIV